LVDLDALSIVGNFFARMPPLVVMFIKYCQVMIVWSF